MANMSVNQRTQFERIDLAEHSTGVRVRHRGRLVAFMAVAVTIFAALSFAAAEYLDSWARALVLAMIVVTVVGAMLALDPLRKS